MINKKLMNLLEEFAPKKYACSWDNVGLLIGHSDQEIKKAVVALDATSGVIEQAVREGADLIITHHPMIFSSMKRVNDDGFLGKKILTLIEHHIAVFAMHTNFDVIGMAQLAGEYLDFPKDARPLEVTVEENGCLEGIGRISKLQRETTLREYADFVKQALCLDHILLFGDENKMIQTVAVSPGSGRSMTELAAKQGADVIITGDIGHHEGLDALDMGLAVIEAGHYGTEYIFIDYVCEFLRKTTDLEIIPIKEGSPYQVL